MEEGGSQQQALSMDDDALLQRRAAMQGDVCAAECEAVSRARFERACESLLCGG